MHAARDAATSGSGGAGPVAAAAPLPPTAVTDGHDAALTLLQGDADAASKPVAAAPGADAAASSHVAAAVPVVAAPAAEKAPEAADAATPAAGSGAAAADAAVPVCIVKSYAGICEQGFSAAQPDKPNQDAIIMTEDAALDSVLLAVFDGHGDNGHIVSGYFREHMPALVFGSAKMHDFVPVADNIQPPATSTYPQPTTKTSVLPAVGAPRLRRNVAGAVAEALQKCEKAVLADKSVDCSLSGCTGCVVVITGDSVTVANVGDSRAILVRTVVTTNAAGETVGVSLQPYQITIDHKPTLLSETKRILIKGGRVHSIRYDDGGEGPVRVWLANDDIPGLAMSRSLGDTVGKKAGVVSDPDFYHYTLCREDAFIVVASDGLWEFTPLPEVADTIGQTHAQFAHAYSEYAAAVQAYNDRVAAGEDAGEPPVEPPPHLSLALDALGAAAAQHWQEREGVMDDTSIVIAEIGTVMVPPAAGGGEAAGGAAGTQ